MNQFVVSARKYRPATFDTVVGQAQITNTLKNAIRNNHLAQSFLFCGPRGVGKTTCARILAKTINCQFITDANEACNECESCVSFNNGQSLNIFELDAASNNSVDDIRNLVEQVRFSPATGKYKIYIIDEVHMLSTAAFNAFLKTLEEPPSYAIFILATTEKHKIIPTILSRCQIFDFNRIQVEDIANHLAFVAGKEGVQAEMDALHIIAQKADGALRDSLSIFDQIVSFAGNKLTYKDVIDNLNILDYDYYFRLTDYILGGNIPSSLLLFNEILTNGFDGHTFINGLAAHFRDLLVCQDPSTIQLLEVSTTTKARYNEQSKKTPVLLLLNLLDICNRCDLDYKASKNQRLHVELALIRMCSAGNSLSGEKKNPELVAEQPSLKTEAPAPSPVSNSFNPAPSVSANAATNPIVTSQPAVEIKPASDVVSTTTTNPLSRGNEEVKNEETNPNDQAVPKEAPVVVKSVGGMMGFSLSNIGKPKPEQTIEIIEEEKPSAPLSNSKVDETQMQEFWMEYAAQFNKSGGHQIYTTLVMNKPTLMAEHEIELVIHNKAQEVVIQEERQGIMDFLRAKLKNDHLNLQTRIVDISGAKTLLTSPKEKYRVMMQQNPDLDEFRIRLGLEVDY
ncbi:MAG: DNA polymerase III subunit gamma/tau [Bacteroidota bacterium]